MIVHTTPPKILGDVFPNPLSTPMIWKVNYPPPPQKKKKKKKNTGRKMEGKKAAMQLGPGQ